MPRLAKGEKIYAVRVGRRPGLYGTWGEAEAEVTGWPRAAFKSFTSMADAQAFMAGVGGVGGARPKSAGAGASSSASAIVGSRAGGSAAAAAVRHGSSGGASASAAAVRHSSSGGASASAAAVRHVSSSSAPARALPQEAPLSLFFDGGSRGNPGPSGCAAVLKAGLGAGAPVVAYSYRGLGRATNNVAEYEGLILGLLLVQDLALAPGRLVAVRGDSMLVVNQLTGAWAVKDANMEKLHAEACRLLLATGISSRAIEHVYRDANAEADHYANLAMDTQGGQSFREAAFFPGHRAKAADAPAPAPAAAAAAPRPQTSVAAAAAAAVAATVAGLGDAAPMVGHKRERASGDRGDDAGPAAQRRRP